MFSVYFSFSVCLFVSVFFPSLLGCELVHQLHGEGEDDGGVLLGADLGEGLEVPQLQGRGALADDVGGLLQGLRCLLLALGGDDLGGKGEEE